MKTILITKLKVGCRYVVRENVTELLRSKFFTEVCEYVEDDVVQIILDNDALLTNVKGTGRNDFVYVVGKSYIRVCRYMTAGKSIVGKLPPLQYFLDRLCLVDNSIVHQGIQYSHVRGVRK